jgi:hypothetical protein
VGKRLEVGSWKLEVGLKLEKGERKFQVGKENPTKGKWDAGCDTWAAL